MTEAERIDYLITILEGGNAAAFADRIGVSRAQVSKMRRGQSGIRLQINSILTAYPTVDRNWLIGGEGYPGDISPDIIKAHYQKKIDRCENIIDHLTRRINELENLIQKSTKG